MIPMTKDFAERAVAKAQSTKRNRAVWRSGSLLMFLVLLAVGAFRLRPVTAEPALAFEEASFMEDANDDPGTLLMPSDVTDDDTQLIALGGDELIQE